MEKGKGLSRNHLDALAVRAEQLLEEISHFHDGVGNPARSSSESEIPGEYLKQPCTPRAENNSLEIEDRATKPLR